MKKIWATSFLLDAMVLLRIVHVSKLEIPRPRDSDTVLDQTLGLMQSVLYIELNGGLNRLTRNLWAHGC